MTEHEQNWFETELRQIRPRELPEEFQARLGNLEVSVAAPASAGRSPAPASPPVFALLLRWLLPATALVLTFAAIRYGDRPGVLQPSTGEGPQVATAFETEPLKPDSIEIGKELVSSFDAVATLPGGEPVRFRCQTWMDQVVVNDKSRGLFVENRSPRVVVVPVGFESY